MFCELVVIDQVELDGSISSLRLTPREDYRRVVVSDLTEIVKDLSSPGSYDAGAVRVYDFSRCKMEVSRIKRREACVSEDGGTIVFSAKYSDLPIGHGGIYNCLLPYGFGFTKVQLIDPYRPEESQPYEHRRIRDQDSDSCGLWMHMRSRHRSFSFELKAEISQRYDRSSAVSYTDALSHILDFGTLLEKSEKDSLIQGLTVKGNLEMNNVKIENSNAPLQVGGRNSMNDVRSRVTHTMPSIDSKSAVTIETLMKELAGYIEQVSKSPDSAEAGSMSEHFERLNNELSQQKPHKTYYEVSLKGLKAAAENIGEVGFPLLKCIGKLAVALHVPILGLSPVL